MFDLVTVEDAIRIEPSDLRLPLDQAVSAVLRGNFVDKVLPGVGLIVALYDIQRVQGGAITQGQGTVQYDAQFRLVAFRPLDGEIIVARLVASSPEGIHLSLGFFADVFIPEESLQTISSWERDDKGEEHWVWQPEAAEGEEPSQLWYDPDLVRFRVTKVVYSTPPSAVELKQAYQNKLEGVAVMGSKEAPFVPMQVVGTVKEDGLGLVSWW